MKTLEHSNLYWETLYEGRRHCGMDARIKSEHDDEDGAGHIPGNKTSHAIPLLDGRGWVGVDGGPLKNSGYVLKIAAAIDFVQTRRVFGG